MVLPFEASGLNNIVDGIELVPEWLAGASNREEAQNSLITLCHRFEIEGAVLLARQSMDNSSEWTVSLSSFTTPEFNQVRNDPEVQEILTERLTNSQMGIVTAELQLPRGGKRLLFIQVNKINMPSAVFVFISQQGIKFTRLAEIRLASDVIWKLLSGINKKSDDEARSITGSSNIEKRIVELQRSGHSSKQISDQLGLSPHTIFHLMQYVSRKYNLN